MKFQASTASLCLPSRSNCSPIFSARVRRCVLGNAASKDQRDFSPSRYSPCWNRWTASICSASDVLRVQFQAPVAEFEWPRQTSCGRWRSRQPETGLAEVADRLRIPDAFHWQFHDCPVLGLGLVEIVQRRVRPRPGSSVLPAATDPVQRPFQTGQWQGCVSCSPHPSAVLLRLLRPDRSCLSPPPHGLSLRTPGFAATDAAEIIVRPRGDALATRPPQMGLGLVEVVGLRIGVTEIAVNVGCRRIAVMP